MIPWRLDFFHRAKLRKKVYLAAAAAVNADFVLLRSCSCWKNGGCHKKAAGRIKFLFELYVFYLWTPFFIRVTNSLVNIGTAEAAAAGEAEKVAS